MYDPTSGTLLLGSGEVKDLSATAIAVDTVRRIAGGGSTYTDDVSALATSFNMNIAPGYGGVTVGPNGDVYVADTGDYTVRRIDSKTGIIKKVAGLANRYTCEPAFGNTSSYGDGGLATNAVLYQPSDVAIGPDGSVYIADRVVNLVRRVGPDGIIRPFAGLTTAPCNTTPGYDGASAEGAVATTTRLSTPVGLAVGPDGSVYIAEEYPGRIRKVDPAGRIWTVAGGGTGSACTGCGNGQAATTVNLATIHDVALGPDGTLYIAKGYELASVRPDGIYRVPNAFDVNIKNQDGLLISAQTIDIDLNSVAVDRAGNVIYNDWEHQGVNSSATNRWWVRAVDAEGYVNSLSISPDSGTAVDGGAALVNGPTEIKSLAAAPNGDVIVSANNRIYRIQKGSKAGVAKCGDPASAYIVPQGGEGYCFDVTGRHLTTIDLRTYAKLYSFAYTNGKLSTITDRAGNQTTVSYATAGHIIVTSPYGQTTDIVLGTNGYAQQIQHLDGSVYSTIDDDGLMSAFTDKRGKLYQFYYDAEAGMLTDDVSPVGDQMFDRTYLSNGFRVDRWSPLGQLTSHSVTRGTDGAVTQKVTQPDGTVRSTVKARSGVTTTVADNTTTTTTPAGDLQYGFLRTFASTTSEKLPMTALTRTTSQTRTATFADSSDPFTMTNETTTRTVGGRTWTTTYDVSTRTSVTTSGSQRAQTTVFDDKGRLAQYAETGVLPVNFEYDAQGRLFKRTQGTRVQKHEYFTSGVEKGYLWTLTNALLQPTVYSRDVMGRPLAEYLNYGGTPTATTGFSWDGNNNLLSVTPPSRPAHFFTYNDVNGLQKYSPPSVSGVSNPATDYIHDADRKPVSETRQGTLAVNRTYDTFGRLDLVTFPESTTGVDADYYDVSNSTGATQGRVKSLKGPYGVDLSFTYDGMLPKQTTWSWLSGTTTKTASITAGYDASFLKTSETLVDAAAAGKATYYVHDADNLVKCATTASTTACPTSAGEEFEVTRAVVTNTNGNSVNQVTTKLGNVTEVITFNEYGEIASQVATYAGTTTPLFAIDYDSASKPRDALGRIRRMTTTKGTSSTTRDYAYNALRQLTDVTTETGNLVEHFEYDSNGNRTVHQSPNSTWTAQYDSQDRLSSRTNGTTGAYTHTPDGAMLSRPSLGGYPATTLQYDALGNLIQVNQPGGYIVKYIVDPKGRRVAKWNNQVSPSDVRKRWVYGDALGPIAELDANGNVVTQFVYVTKQTVPDYMVKGGVTYRIISDHLGSPRYVVNVRDAVDVPYQADYTAFGVATRTLASGISKDWIPFAFAGGLYDSDVYDIGLLRFGARDYDPVIGRWVSKDPIRFDGGQANIYVYVGNDPVNHSDPLGLMDTCNAVAGVASTAICYFGCGAIGASTGGAGLVCALGCGGFTMMVSDELCKPPPPRPEPYWPFPLDPCEGPVDDPDCDSPEPICE